MKSKFLKGILSTVFALSVMTSFALPSNPEGELSPEEENPPASNIDSSLVVLMMGAVAFGTYTLVKKRKQVRN